MLDLPITQPTKAVKGLRRSRRIAQSVSPQSNAVNTRETGCEPVEPDLKEALESGSENELLEEEEVDDVYDSLPQGEVQDLDNDDTASFFDASPAGIDTSRGDGGSPARTPVQGRNGVDALAFDSSPLYLKNFWPTSSVNSTSGRDE